MVRLRKFGILALICIAAMVMPAPMASAAGHAGKTVAAAAGKTKKAHKGKHHAKKHHKKHKKHKKAA